MENEREKRDLVLAPGEYTYMQDVTKGQIKVSTGPTVVNATAQDRPIIYVPAEGRFKPVAKLEESLRKSPIAVQGYYLVLKNPTEKGDQPLAGSTQGSPDLIIGRKINIPGPVTFSLWPGQDAQMIRGHHLRSNQYLLVRVYDEDAARKNWTKAVVKPASSSESKSDEPTKSDEATKMTMGAVTQPIPDDLTVGRELIIRGTEISFFIPPTGISVVAEGNQFVRDALTLERLEYCILVDEDGNKRYEIGPAVVFPEPSEKFMADKKGNTKFRATELNEVQGLHIKVIADYEGLSDEDHPDGHFRTGEELFVTGKETTIYFPREEHSLIKYDGRSKHFATAVPAGEGRYVMERLSGLIRLERGPRMLLPDPRSEVMVRRVLSDKECELWYPGNVEALLYNQELRKLLAHAPTTRQGAVTEGEISRGAAKAAKTSSPAGGAAADAMRSAGIAYAAGSQKLLASNFVAQMDQSLVSSDAAGMVGDEFSRASTYTQPRTVTLDTKYQGAPSVDVWTGYAILVVSKTGDRRVEQGPKTVLLEYDESLEMLTLSRGKPKTTADLLHTAYLRVLNNKISDIIEVETRDHVRCLLKLSLRVNFEGDPNRWFSVENYVKFMTDHVRSVLKGAVKRMPVQQFYADHVSIVRDTVLGVAEGTADGVRPGMRFSENGMRVVDVEVLDVKINDATIGGLLTQAQLQVMRGNIEVEAEQRALEIGKERERVARERAQAEHETLVFKNNLEIVQLEDLDKVDLRKFELAKAEKERAKEVEEKAQLVKDVVQQAELARSKAGADLQLDVAARTQSQLLERMNAEVESVVARFTAAQAGFSEALLALSNNETLQKVAEAWSIQRVIGGQNVSEALQRVFEGTPLSAIAKKLVGSNGSGESPRPVAPTPAPR